MPTLNPTDLATIFAIRFPYAVAFDAMGENVDSRGLDESITKIADVVAGVVNQLIVLRPEKVDALEWAIDVMGAPVDIFIETIAMGLAPKMGAEIGADIGIDSVEDFIWERITTGRGYEWTNRGGDDENTPALVVVGGSYVIERPLLPDVARKVKGIQPDCIDDDEYNMMVFVDGSPVLLKTIDFE